MDSPGEWSIGEQCDTLEFLTQSRNRVAVLRTLAADGPLDRYELERAIDATRRTLLRTVNGLEDRGYVERSDGAIGVTALGRHVVDHYEAFRSAVALDEAMETFLAGIPADALDVDVERLRDGTVTTTGPGQQYAPLDRMLDLRATATEIRELAPGVERRSVEQLAARIERGEDLDVEIVVTEETLAAADGLDQYADHHETIVGANCVDLAVHPDPFDLPLGILDETVVLFARGDDGYPTAILETEDPVVREWALEVFERHRRRSTPVSPR